MSDELLIRFLLKETGPDEDEAVKLWIAENAGNQKQFKHLQLIWDTSKKLASTSTRNENAAWERLKAKILLTKADTKPVKLWQRYSWMKAAAVLLLFGGAWLIYSVAGHQGDTLNALNHTLTQTLPDGSEVTLNKNSVLSYSFSAISAQRKVRLKKGEVFFNVSADKKKPFVIEADDVTIEVVGTSFNVKHSDKQTEVIVETGNVKVSKGKQTTELHAGEKVIAGKGSLIIKKSSDSLYNYYRTRKFVANNTPLWRLVEVLKDAYNTEIVIEDPNLRNLTLTTTFHNEPLNRILQVVGETLNCTVLKQGNRYILR